jgi:xanthine dehydrogenase accessory factor
VVGETPVAQALVRLAGDVGFAVSSALPEDRRTLGASTAVVVATMGPGDEEALAAASASGAAYVGLVASRKKAAYLFDFLRASGVPSEQLARVKAPAGLDLGGMTSGEIALSILAEIVQRRHGAATPRRRTPDAKRALTVATLPVDPICGMPVDPATAKHTLTTERETLYFCCPHCKAAYAKAHA